MALPPSSAAASDDDLPRALSELTNEYKYWMETNLIKELSSLRFGGKAIRGVYVTPSHETLQVWHGCIFLHSGVFAGACFKFVMTFPETTEGLPEVVFVTPFTHPLVSSRGRVALDKIRIRVVGGDAGSGVKGEIKGRALSTLTLLKNIFSPSMKCGGWSQFDPKFSNADALNAFMDAAAAAAANSRAMLTQSPPLDDVKGASGGLAGESGFALTFSAFDDRHREWLDKFRAECSGGGSASRGASSASAAGGKLHAAFDNQ